MVEGRFAYSEERAHADDFKRRKVSLVVERGKNGEEVNRGRLIAWKRNWEGSHRRTAVTIVSGTSIPWFPLSNEF